MPGIVAITGDLVVVKPGIRCLLFWRSGGRDNQRVNTLNAIELCNNTMKETSGDEVESNEERPIQIELIREGFSQWKVTELKAKKDENEPPRRG